MVKLTPIQLSALKCASTSTYHTVCRYHTISYAMHSRASIYTCIYSIRGTYPTFRSVAFGVSGAYHSFRNNGSYDGFIHRRKALLRIIPYCYTSTHLYALRIYLHISHWRYDGGGRNDEFKCYGRQKNVSKLNAFHSCGVLLYNDKTYTGDRQSKRTRDVETQRISLYRLTLDGCSRSNT